MKASPAVMESIKAVTLEAAAMKPLESAYFLTQMAAFYAALAASVLAYNPEVLGDDPEAQD